jgi:ribosomal-protein-alanine N-acetyltransferase
MTGNESPAAMPAAPQVRLRRMQRQDLPKVLAIEERLYPYPWTEGIFRDCLQVQYECWLLEPPQGEDVLAYAVFSHAIGEAHLLNLAVAPDWQRQGWGRFLLSQCMVMARARACARMFLEVRRSNLPALHLYQSSGFVHIGTRKGYYPAANGREDALVLAS